MADESEPESKPITVSELIARSEGDDAFPRSESVSVRRARRDDERTTTAAGPTSSGMPSYRAPKTSEEPRSPRVVGASGMPGYSPTAEPDPGPEANAVTGIIPVVSDDPDADTGSLRAVDADDFFADELPPTEYRRVEADSGPMMQVRSQEASPFEETASIPVVGDQAAPEPDDTGTVDKGTVDKGTVDDGAGTDDADTDSVPDVVDSEPALTGRAARKAARRAKAERKAAEKAERDAALLADKKADKKADRKADKKTDEDADSTVAAAVATADTESDSSTFSAIGAEIDNKADNEAEAADTRQSPTLGWLAFAGELILGLAVGAGLFWGFTELWKRYVYLALILAVVVIFAIVTFAHVLRKRDLPTTLLALGVGMVVTIGPLVLLAAQP